MNRQIRRLGVALMVLFAALFVQLNHIQVLQASKLANSPGNTRTVTANFSRPRGVIRTADGVVVARSVPSNDAFKYQRQYPQGPLYGQITGYYSFVYGSDGVERTYDPQLTGRSLPIRSIHDLLAPRQSTGDVTLTIDSRLQQAAQTALGNKVGSVVVMRPSDGAVLAMWSYPSYDPNPLAAHKSVDERSAWNLYNLNKTQPMLPRAYRRSYPPGSTFKVIDSTAVYDHNPSLSTKSYPVVSSIPLPDTTNKLHNFQGETCGGQLPEMLKVSCDTGFGQVGLDLGADNLSAAADAFGFNQRPPLDLPGVAKSTFPPASFFRHNRPLVAFAAIGQADVSATALQMALVAAGIANNGTIMTPHVMSDIRDADGNVVKKFAPKPWIQATSPQTAQQVGQLMIGVTQPGGTAPDLN
ncbi:MAG TPA: penicillin-binding transpeptidase domain-containing protein, partial [Acidimicrobiales bacterium]|nr:penicillin-binding transpeptidase domain-containing protein [Acidimicrobiales bacterium]